MVDKYANLKKLKKVIETNTLSDNLYVFINTNDFITDQYVNRIAKLRKLKIEYIESINALTTRATDIFGLDNTATKTLRILHIDDFKSNDKQLLSVKDCIIICRKITDTETKELFEDIIIEYPKLENWCVKDYVYSNVNISDKAKEWLLSICNDNIMRIQCEIDKLNIFDKKDQKKLFDEFVSDGVFDDLSGFNIFDFTNSILTKKVDKVKQILIEKDNIDIEPLGVLTLLFNNIKNIISIQMNPSATAQSLGISDKQFIAIKYRTNIFSNEQLFKIFNMLIKVDEQLKTGYLDEKNLIDYMLVNIL